jgi:streptogramin lyase
MKQNILLFFMAFILGATALTTQAQVVTTWVGTAGVSGTTDGTGIAASISSPTAVATDSSGNVYLADALNHLIRKITPLGVVSTFAGTAGVSGSTDGIGTLALFNNPTGLATDTFGNVYVADRNNNLIRKITPLGNVCTFAGDGTMGNSNGTGTSASFFFPSGVATDASGNVYVADLNNNIIRKITPLGVVSTFAGSGLLSNTNGIGLSASFSLPFAVATDASGNLYVTELYNHAIRKITPQRVVTTFAGNVNVPGRLNSTTFSARFNYPRGVATDTSGNVYVADQSNQLIRKITPLGVVSSLAGTVLVSGTTDGIGTLASFYLPGGVATHKSGKVYVADEYNHLIRKIILEDPCISKRFISQTICSGSSYLFNGIAQTNSGVYLDTFTNVAGCDSIIKLKLIVSPLPTITSILATPNSICTGNNAIIKALPGGGVSGLMVNTLAGSGPGNANGAGTSAMFQVPSGVATDASGNVYVADASNYVIRKINPQGVVSNFAGTGAPGNSDGTASTASFNYPTGVATDASGNVYVADKNNNLIRKISPLGIVSTLAGSGSSGSTNGIGTAASFNNPTGVCADLFGNIYVADRSNHLIRKITSLGVVSTLAGTAGLIGDAIGLGIAARFYHPTGVTTDASGNVYVADEDNQRICKITPLGAVSVFAGYGGLGSDDGPSYTASFRNPTSVATDDSGNVYVADKNNSIIRKITPQGEVSTLAGTAQVVGNTNGPASSALFNSPLGIATDASGNIYVAQWGDYLIRTISTRLPANYTWSPKRNQP